LYRWLAFLHCQLIRFRCLPVMRTTPDRYYAVPLSVLVALQDPGPSLTVIDVFVLRAFGFICVPAGFLPLYLLLCILYPPVHFRFARRTTFMDSLPGLLQFYLTNYPTRCVLYSQLSLPCLRHYAVINIAIFLIQCYRHLYCVGLDVPVARFVCVRSVILPVALPVKFIPSRYPVLPWITVDLTYGLYYCLPVLHLCRFIRYAFYYSKFYFLLFGWAVLPLISVNSVCIILWPCVLLYIYVFCLCVCIVHFVFTVVRFAFILKFYWIYRFVCVVIWIHFIDVWFHFRPFQVDYLLLWNVSPIDLLLQRDISCSSIPVCLFVLPRLLFCCSDPHLPHCSFTQDFVSLLTFTIMRCCIITMLLIPRSVKFFCSLNIVGTFYICGDCSFWWAVCLRCAFCVCRLPARTILPRQFCLQLDRRSQLRTRSGSLPFHYARSAFVCVIHCQNVPVLSRLDILRYGITGVQFVDLVCSYPVDSQR